MWDFANSSKWYDIILGDYSENINFVSNLLKKSGSKTVLELGCGTGLYLFKLDFDIEGLDISKEMLNVARKKGNVQLYEQDMTVFDTGKSYDAILILNSGLALLPSEELMVKTIERCKRFLNPGGILLIDLPNHEKEIKEAKQEHVQYKIPGGTLDVIFKHHKNGNKWIEEWDCSVIENGKHSHFTEHFEELIFSPEVIEKSLGEFEMFGSRKGGKFSSNSFRRVYFCRV